MKFTSKGSVKIECNFDKEKRQLHISVQDTGLGIRKNEQVKLFKMFGKVNRL